jgi:hypothetical protein
VSAESRVTSFRACRSGVSKFPVSRMIETSTINTSDAADASGRPPCLSAGRIDAGACRRCANRCPCSRSHAADHQQIGRQSSGLTFPVAHGDGRVTLGFENSAVYQDAGDAFEAAQRSIVATVPGAVYRTSTAASTCSARYPRPDRTARAAVLRDLVRSAGRSPQDGELPAYRRHCGQSDPVGGRLRDLARLREAWCTITCKTACGTARSSCRKAGRTTR